jgi:hypothetical protein
MTIWNNLLLKAATAPNEGTLGAGLSLWRIFGAWLLCIGIAVALILMLRRVRSARIPRGAGAFLPRALTPAARQISIVETRRINLSADLCIFDYAGERYLVAVGPGGTMLLDKSAVPLPDPEDSPA